MSFNVKKKPIESFTAIEYNRDNKEKVLKLLEDYGYKYTISNDKIFAYPFIIELNEYIVTDLESIKFYKDKESVLVDYFNADKYKFKLEEK